MKLLSLSRRGALRRYGALRAQVILAVHCEDKKQTKSFLFKMKSAREIT